MSKTVFHTCQTPNGRYFRAWTEGVLWEQGAREQVHRLLTLPFVKDVAVMADTHLGFGGPVGVAVKFEGAIIPSVIGVDIGCGMKAVKLFNVSAHDLTPEVLPELRHALESVIPHGITPGNDRGSWGEVPPDIKAAWVNDHNGEELPLADEYDDLIARFDEDSSFPLVLHPLRNGQTAEHRDPLSQLGTLGTGNHFFEVSTDQFGYVWAVVHSGSRGAGNRIGDYFTKRAQDLMAKWFISLPEEDRNLAYLPEGTPEYQGYVDFMKWAQKYARLNRALMMERALTIAFPRVLKRHVVRDGAYAFDIHHNYLDLDTLVARKGAVHLKPGGLAIIPGAMGRRSYIVRGLEGLKASLQTCSHGAGRAMSRTAAETLVPLEKHQADLAGVECDKSEGTLDETPSAYKDVDAVINAQRDLVEPLYVLNAKVCVKGAGLKNRRRK